MKTKLTLDQAGRERNPKSLQGQFHLGPGDEIRLRPGRADAVLRKELGVWVFEAKAHSRVSVTKVIDQQRQARVMAMLDRTP
jgi:hypothetical protein